LLTEKNAYKTLVGPLVIERIDGMELGNRFERVKGARGIRFSSESGRKPGHRIRFKPQFTYAS